MNQAPIRAAAITVVNPVPNVSNTVFPLMRTAAFDDGEADGLASARTTEVDGGTIVYNDPPKTVVIPLAARVIAGPFAVMMVTGVPLTVSIVWKNDAVGVITG